jgi:hypothetical protein
MLLSIKKFLFSDLEVLLKFSCTYLKYIMKRAAFLSET